MEDEAHDAEAEEPPALRAKDAVSAVVELLAQLVVIGNKLPVPILGCLASSNETIDEEFQKEAVFANKELLAHEDETVELPDPPFNAYEAVNAYEDERDAVAKLAVSEIADVPAYKAYMESKLLDAQLAETDDPPPPPFRA